MNKILDLETFTDRVEEATRQAGFAVEKCDGEHLYVKLSGLSQRFGLNMLYNIYQAEPNRLDTIIDTHINVLSSIPEAAAQIIEPESLQGLFPLLQQKRWLKKTEERCIGPLTHERLVTGVVVTYVFDFPEYRTYLNHATLTDLQERTSLAESEIYDTALENLRQRVQSYKFDRHGVGRHTMISCESTDGYAATSILLPELLKEWSARIPGEMLIGIPNRDFLIVFSDQHPAGPDQLARQVGSDTRQREYPLFSDLLVWRNGKIREFRPFH